MKTVIVARVGNLSVADHVAEMQAWLAERDIRPREPAMLQVLDLRVVFRAQFEVEHDVHLFAERFG